MSPLIPSDDVSVFCRAISSQFYFCSVISCPGGLGTFEELSEFLCQRQLGLHQKPIALLNTRGFFNPLLQQFKHMTAEGFLPAAHLSLIVEDDVDTLLDKVPPSP